MFRSTLSSACVALPNFIRLAVATFALVLASPVLRAEVVSVEVTHRAPWVGGKSYGRIGAYEVLSGTVHYALDPKGLKSSDIADIQVAPRNANGMVEYMGPFVLIRPVDASRGNHATLIEVANRGRTEMDGLFFETEDGLDLMKPEGVKSLTDPTFFELGYSLAWVGWQARLGDGSFDLQVPVAPVHSVVRASFSAEDMTLNRTAYDLEGDGYYCARDTQQSNAELRAHLRFNDLGALVPREAWQFERTKDDGNSRAECGIRLKRSAAKDAYFSLTYQGENAPVMGLGEAAFRDFAAHLKYRDIPSEINNRPADNSALFAYGYSQGGRFLRDFLYRGFNADKNHRQVFDGMLVTTAGSGRGSFNHRYALPSQAGNSVLSDLRATDLYPFADTATPDINGKGHDSLLARAVKDRAVPKIMYILTSSGYWARNASLLQTTTDGKRSVALGKDSRLYLFSGVAHAVRANNAFKRKGKEASYPYNANIDLADAMNALLEDLKSWAVNGIAPPASIAPVLGRTLVDASKIGFPALPDIRVPRNPPPLWQLDLGPEYAGKGIIKEPVKAGREYPLLVPAVDPDGNELGGWRGPMSSVPLGTFTAWNWMMPQFERFGFISGLYGAFIPFARTRAERIAAKDPRLSIEERYVDRAGFMRMVAVAVGRAISHRFLLSSQRKAIIEKMGRNWDDTMRFDWYFKDRQTPSDRP